MITLETAQKENRNALTAYFTARKLIETFDEEETRGIMHKKEFEDRIAFLRKDLPNLNRNLTNSEKQLEAAEAIFGKAWDFI